ncbi:MAG: AMMECR1 domain-containing protein [Ignavibacteria bacterium]
MSRFGSVFSSSVHFTAMLSSNERQMLLSVVREAIASALRAEPFTPPPPNTEALARPAGAFVTLRHDHELRGCIGYIESEKPLIQVVAEVAVKAAFDDPRFPPLRREEFERVSIEVSVLTPLRCIHSIDEIEVGVHGIVVVLGARRGLLLPQVAVEHHLDREAFLTAALHKAGLPASFRHAPDLELYVFEAEVVSEADVLQ